MEGMSKSQVISSSHDGAGGFVGDGHVDVDGDGHAAAADYIGVAAAAAAAAADDDSDDADWEVSSNAIGRV